MRHEMIPHWQGCSEHEDRIRLDIDEDPRSKARSSGQAVAPVDQNWHPWYLCPSSSMHSQPVQCRGSNGAYICSICKLRQQCSGSRVAWCGPRGWLSAFTRPPQTASIAANQPQITSCCGQSLPLWHSCCYCPEGASYSQSDRAVARTNSQFPPHASERAAVLNVRIPWLLLPSQKNDMRYIRCLSSH